MDGLLYNLSASMPADFDASIMWTIHAVRFLFLSNALEYYSETTSSQEETRVLVVQTEHW